MPSTDLKTCENQEEEHSQEEVPAPSHAEIGSHSPFEKCRTSGVEIFPTDKLPTDQKALL